jgi:hypothetical protein
MNGSPFSSITAFVAGGKHLSFANTGTAPGAMETAKAIV